MYIADFITYNRPRTKLTAKGVVLHATATPGATAKNEQKYFNSANRGASAHAFVDWTDIVQCIPYNEQAWHAGPTANKNYIGIEMCEPKGFDSKKFAKVLSHTVGLIADLMRDLGITQVTKENLMSHAEVSAKWRETDHTDPTAYLKTYGYTMDDIRRMVQNKLTPEVETPKEYLSPEEAISVLVSKGIINEPSKWYEGTWTENDFKWLLRKVGTYIQKL